MDTESGLVMNTQNSFLAASLTSRPHLHICVCVYVCLYVLGTHTVSELVTKSKGVITLLRSSVNSEKWSNMEYHIYILYK